MLSRLVYFLTGVYGGVVAHRMYKKHKELEAWAPTQVWARARARLEDRTRLLKNQSTLAGYWLRYFNIGSDNSDEVPSTRTETQRSTKECVPADDRDLEENIKSMKEKSLKVKEIFEDKLRMWEVSAPEMKTMIEERLKTLKGNSPDVVETLEDRVGDFLERESEKDEKLEGKVEDFRTSGSEMNGKLEAKRPRKERARGNVQEKIRDFEEQRQDLSAQLHEKITVWKETVSQMKKVKDRNRCFETTVAIDKEVVGEKIKDFSEMSFNVRDTPHEMMKAVEERIEFNDVAKEEAKAKGDKVEEIERNLDQAENVFNMAPEFHEKEESGKYLKLKIPEYADLLENKEILSKSNSLQEIDTEEEERNEINDEFPALKKEVKERENIFSSNHSNEFKKLVEEKHEFKEESVSDVKAAQEQENMIKDSFLDVGKKEEDDKVVRYNEDNLQEKAKSFKESVDIVKEMLSDYQELSEDRADSNVCVRVEIESQSPKVAKENTFDVKEMFKEKIKALKQNTPEVTEMLKGKMNALRKKFRRDNSGTERKTEPAVHLNDVPKDEREIAPKNEPQVEPENDSGK